MDNQKQDSEFLISQISERLTLLSPKKQKELLTELRIIEYDNALYSIDEMKEDKSSIALRALTLLYCRVVMVMYYVQNYEIRNIDRQNSSLWERNGIWMPDIDEVIELLNISRGEIEAVKIIYMNIFIKKAEKCYGYTIEEKLNEYFDNYKEMGKYEYEISKIKDLAKLLMIQNYRARIRNGGSCASYYWLGEYDKDIRHIWQQVEEDGIDLGIKPEFLKTVKNKTIKGDIIWSVRIKDVDDNMIEPVLRAYEMLENRTPYDDVMTSTGLERRIVRIIDCFVKTDRDQSGDMSRGDLKRF